METRLTSEQREAITVNELAGHIGSILQESKRIPNRIPGFPPHIYEGLCDEKDPNSKDEFFKKFCEAIALLKRRGLVMDAVLLGSHGGGRSHEMPYTSLLLTSDGEKTDFTGEILILDDAQETVNSFNQEIPNPDPVVSQYYLESIRACQNDLCISSVICLGVASEKVIDLLAEAINDHITQTITGTAAQIVADLLKDNSLLFNQIFDPLTDKNSRNEIKHQLDRMGGIYRLNRNDAAHAIPVLEITRYEQVCHLVSFRKYAKTIFKAIELLAPNP